jgi:hypothetical protein
MATDARQAQAQEWARRIRRLEPQALQWIYESESSAIADLARRTLAQAVGLRRLLDQIGGRVSVHGEESQL